MIQKIKQANNRKSGIELLRILMMFIIILHHSIVNSPVMPIINSTSGGGSLRNLVALFLGWGGKTAIDVFLLITGYYQCIKEIKWKKLLNLYLLIKFYRLIILCVFIITGYEKYSNKILLKAVFGVGHGLMTGFSTSYLVLYAVSPFINIWLKGLDKKKLSLLIVILLVVFSLIPTAMYSYHFEYFGWYVTVYLIGAWLRFYAPDFLMTKKWSLIGSCSTVLLSWSSIACIFIVSNI